MKICPFCAEEIQDAAVKCRYCGSELAAEPSPDDPSAVEASALPAAPGPASARVWVIAGGLVILAAAIGTATSLHFHRQAEEARERETQARAPLADARAEPTVLETQAAPRAQVEPSAVLENESGSAPPGESDIAEARLLYKSTLTVPASSFREVLIGNAERYGEIFGKFESAKKQEVTVLALNEAEFFRYRTGGKVDGHEWTNVADQFSFAPDAASCFLVVQHKNRSGPASVSLEVYGRPRLEASREVERPSTP